MRLKDDYDGAEPSGNSIALMNLLRLSRITGRREFEDSGRKLLSTFHGRLAAVPSGMPQMLAAAEFDIAPQREIVVAGNPTGDMVRLLWANFDPNRILLHADPETARYQLAIAGMSERGGETTVYVCDKFACREPVTSVEDLAGLLR
jgi:uncharacterized protein YyaL (SSP411 family)